MTNEQSTKSKENFYPCILLVDDEEQVLKSLKRLLRREWDVYTANSGEEAYGILKNNAIHVIVSDQRMPGMTGTELLSRVNEYNPDIICILLTGYSDIQAVINAINSSKVYRYLTKPWDAEDMNLTLREAFQKYNLKIENKVLLNKLQETNEWLEKKVKERTQQLIEANKRLEDLNDQKNKFLGMACHDLRSPLSSIIMITELLLHKNQLTKEQNTRVQTVYDSAEGMLNIIENFINVSVIEAGKVNIKTELISIYEYIEKLFVIQKVLATENNFEIALDVEPDLPNLHVDEQRLTQVFNNLLNNAYKFTSPNSTITIKIKRQNNFIEFSVCDQGNPIPQAEIENIFSAFERSNYHKMAGSGLGLFICKEMIQLHGGSISVESDKEKGNRFFFTIPIEKQN